jgi:DNA topoisomerase I
MAGGAADRRRLSGTRLALRAALMVRSSRSRPRTERRRSLRPSRPARRTRAEILDLPSDPVESAEEAGLRYVSDTSPGIRRRRSGRGFTYVGVDGGRIHDPRQLERIRALAIPPAWTDVWISPTRRGHIQATGRDARKRKQYRYHPRWHSVRDEVKYERMVAFAAALPGIRARTEADLRRQGLPREKVLAAVVGLLEQTMIRVGNDEYARDNDSYGLTTMEDEHARVSDRRVVFRYRGKNGKEHETTLDDPRLARIVGRCQDLPGQRLFQYEDEDGSTRDVDSADVNAYIGEISGEPFTAKDFRTWAGTVLAAVALADGRSGPEAVREVAEELGNTPAVARGSYIDPRIVEQAEDGATVEPDDPDVEEAVIDLLEEA